MISTGPLVLSAGIEVTPGNMTQISLAYATYHLGSDRIFDAARAPRNLRGAPMTGRTEVTGAESYCSAPGPVIRA
jgi:hypothetical protein